MKVYVELDKLMTPEIIEKLKNTLRVPGGVSEGIGTDTVSFLTALKKWKDFDPCEFDAALEMIGGKLQYTARQLKWLSSPSSLSPASADEPHPTNTFRELLITGMTKKHWIMLTASSSKVSLDGKESGNQIFQLCIENSIITRDTEDLAECLEILKRNDLASKVRGYASTFKKMSDEEFRSQMLLS